MPLEIVMGHEPGGEDNTFTFGETAKPTGKIDITENGTYDVTDKATAVVDVPVGVFPSGTLDIRENGDYDVRETENVHVDVPGEVPTGEIDITENGTYDVAGKASANVNVPVGVFPSGTLDVSANGTYDVTEKENVNVNVPGIIPTGEIDITENGHYLVDTYESATVKVPQGDLRPPIVIKSALPPVVCEPACNNNQNIAAMVELSDTYPICLGVSTATKVYGSSYVNNFNSCAPKIEIKSISGASMTLNYDDIHESTLSSNVFKLLYKQHTLYGSTITLEPKASYTNTVWYNGMWAGIKYSGNISIRIIPSETEPRDNNHLWYICIYAPNCVDLRIGMTDTIQKGLARVDVFGRMKQTDFSNFFRNMQNFQGGIIDLTDATNVTDFLRDTTPNPCGLTIYGYPTKTDNSLWDTNTPEPPPPED